MSGRSSERQQRVHEKHGSLKYCCVSGCKWTSSRAGRLRTHLDNAHGGEETMNRTLPSEFRASTAQSSAFSSNHVRTLGAKIGSDFTPTPPLKYNDEAFMPDANQSQPDASEASIIPDEEATSHPDSNPKSYLRAGQRARVQAARRVFRQCRAIKRRPRITSRRTSSSSPSLALQASGGESTRRCYANKHENSIPFQRWMAEPVGVERIALSLCSFGLDCSIN